MTPKNVHGSKRKFESVEFNQPKILDKHNVPTNLVTFLALRYAGDPLHQGRRVRWIIDTWAHGETASADEVRVHVLSYADIRRVLIRR
jgi:hypothetical protein